MKQFVTLEEVNQAIAEQEKARDQALAQANFNNGYISALKVVKERLEAAGEDFPEAIDAGAEVTPAPVERLIKEQSEAPPAPVVALPVAGSRNHKRPR